MKKLVLFSLLLLLVNTTGLFADNVYFEPTTIEQPDGTIYEMYLTGDEFFHRVHDANGYVVMLNQDGWWYYAQAIINGVWIASEYKLGAVNPSNTKLNPWVGITEEEYRNIKNSYKSAEMIDGKSMTNGKSTAVFVFIKFKDQTEFSTTYLNDLDSTINARNSKSVYGYWQEVSYGNLFLNGCLVRNTYTTNEPRAYFLPYNATTNPIGYKDKDEKQVRRKKMLQDAAAFVRNSVPNSYEMDMNKDGKLDFLAFVIRGNSGAWADLLWPHAGSVSFTEYFNDLKLSRYVFLTENKATMSTINHEFFHNMGAPDLYRYSNTDIDPAPQCFASSNVHPSAYMKWLHSDQTWVKDIPVINEPGRYTVWPLYATDGDGEKKSAYRINSPFTNNQYFIVEYRKKGGNYETGLGKSGLMIGRYYPTKNGNGNGPPDEVYIYRNGGNHLQNGDKSAIFYASELSKTEINDQTNPSSFLIDGSNGGLNISNISSAGNSMSFDVSFGVQMDIINGNAVKIVNQASGMAASGTSGNVDCRAVTGNDNQIWVPEFAGAGNWKLIHKATGKVATVKQNATSEGADIVLEEFSNATGQKWLIIPLGNGYYKIMSQLNKKVFTGLSSGTGNIVHSTFNSGNNSQKWRFDKIAPVILPGAHYTILSKFNGKAVEVSGASLLAGTNLVQETMDKAQNQRWEFLSVGTSDEYMLKAVHSNLYAGTDGSKPVQTETTNATLWKLKQNSDGSVAITTENGLKAVSVNQTNYNNGEAFMIANYEASQPAQHFYIINLSGIDIDASEMVTADFMTTSRIAAVGDTVVFKSLAQNNPSNVLWQINGARIVSANNDSAIVIFDFAGKWDATLWVSNSKSSDVKTIPGFMTILNQNAGAGLTFDGQDDWIEPDSLDKNITLTEFTVEYWIKPNTLKNYNQNIGNSDVLGEPFYITADSWGSITFACASPLRRIAQASNALSVGEWTHVACVYSTNSSTGTARIYINGILSATQSGMPKSIGNWQNLKLGSSSGTTIDGTIDEFRLWRKARTQQQIVDYINYEIGNPDSEPDLWIYYNFNSPENPVPDMANYHRGIMHNFDINDMTWEGSGAFSTDGSVSAPSLSVIFENDSAAINSQWKYTLNESNSKYLSWVITGPDTLIFSGKQPTIFAEKPGLYKYSVTAINSAGTKTINGTITVTDSKSSVYNKNASGIRVYTTNNKVVVESYEPCSVLIYDVAGRVYKTAVTTASVTIIPIEKSGIYLVVTNNNGRIVSKKVTIF